MKIAWIVYGSLDLRTGGTIYDRIVVDGLRAAGDQVRVYALDPPPTAASLAIPLGVANGLRLAGTLRRSRPDVVVGDELCFREIAAAFPFLRSTGARRVLLVHHLTCWEEEVPWHARRIARQAELLAIAASDAMIATSHATRDRLLRDLASAHRGGAPVIDVVVPGADRLPLLPRTARDRVRLTFLGAIIPRKRVLPLVQAFARAASSEAELALVGSTTRDPAYARDIARTIDALGLAGRVVMTGEASDEAIARALSESDALVMPSSLEGFGIAAIEAVHAGVPVIAARTEGLEEALAHARGAVRFASTEEDLAEELRRFTTDRRARAESLAAAESARSAMPTWADCIADFRRSLAARSRPRSPPGRADAGRS
ncbi:MAG: glycosyltransferase family 4 protein [Deltaproteobacteria bacterium]|nr:glycosyltransferase family 4 protein [Deltaproteobacteria bacterium]